MAHPSTAPVYRAPLTSTSEWLLWRFIERDHPRAEEAFAELNRRELTQQREKLFNLSTPRTLVYARNLKPGMVLTAGRYNRMVVRQAFPLPQSGRIAVSVSYADENTGVIATRVIDLPVLAGDHQLDLVAATVPACLTYADATEQELAVTA